MLATLYVEYFSKYAAYITQIAITDEQEIIRWLYHFVR